MNSNLSKCDLKSEKLTLFDTEGCIEFVGNLNADKLNTLSLTNYKMNKGHYNIVKFCNSVVLFHQLHI